MYHWSFIYPTSSEDAIKFHAVIGPDSWLYQKDEHFIARSKHACVVVQLSKSGPDIGSETLLIYKIFVADLPGTCTVDELDRVLCGVPLTSPAGDDETFTCRVWLRMAAAKLHEARIINCLDPNDLEGELKRLASQNNQRSLTGLGFTLHKSHICP